MTFDVLMRGLGISDSRFEQRTASQLEYTLIFRPKPSVFTEETPAPIWLLPVEQLGWPRESTYEANSLQSARFFFSSGTETVSQSQRAWVGVSTTTKIKVESKIHHAAVPRCYSWSSQPGPPGREPPGNISARQCHCTVL